MNIKSTVFAFALLMIALIALLIFVQSVGL
jgi:hypothetical protein